MPTYKEHLIASLYKILKEIDYLNDQASVYNQFEKEMNKLYTDLDLLIEKIENTESTTNQ